MKYNNGLFYFITIIMIICTFIMFPQNKAFAQNNNEEDNIEEKDKYNFISVEDVQDIIDFLPQIDYYDSKVRKIREGSISSLIPPKDPFLSSLLSITFSGLGHLYIGNNPFKSSVLMLSEVVILGIGIGYFFVLQNNYSTYDDPEIRWKEMNGENKIAIITIALSYVGLKMYTVVDSYNEAVNYNRKYFNVYNNSNMNILISLSFTNIGINLKANL